MTTMLPNLYFYPAYKPSGVEWLGDVPAHWDVRRIATVTSIVNGATPSSESPEYWNGTIMWVTPEDLGRLNGRYIGQSARQITLEGYRSCGTTVASPGSIVISTRAPIGHLAILSGEACVNQGCRLLSLNEQMQSEYLYYLLLISRPHLESLGSGSTFSELSRIKLADFRIVAPPLDEQTAIVRYLDQADERIQRAISAKERLIELLTEQRQAIIHQAVTRGLDPNVRLKDSGVEWLADVPEHWEVIQLGRIGAFSKCSGGTKADEASEGIPCVRYGDLYTSHRTFIEQTRSYITKEKAGEYTPIEYGDILFAGSGETIEDIGISAVNLLETQVRGGGDIILFRPQLQMNARFSGYLLDSSQSQYQKSCMGRGITVMHVYASELKYLWLGIPPLDEQTAIARHLDKATTDIDAEIDNAQRQIDLLREYRTRLIADVVTGQVDVRGAVEQAELPVS